MSYNDSTQPRYFLREVWLNSPLRIVPRSGICAYNGADYLVDPATGDLCREDVAAARGLASNRPGRKKKVFLHPSL